MSQNFCSHCGAPVALGDRACPRCGTPLFTASPDGATVSSVKVPTAPEPPDEYEGTPTIAAVPVSLDGVVFSTGPLRPGEAFGTRYHVIRLLGAGGMGAVYQAWDEELGVAVAIKVMRPAVGTDPSSAEGATKRFKRELVLARQITHINVVRIHDLGEINGIKYITMPYVNGEDLGSVLRKEGKLAISEALAIARQVVSGLQAAHAAGVVHRDLKPANIMIEDGHVYIMDFGIARPTESAATMLTQAGGIIGSVEYMAPEQAKADAIDHRADIYAFGLILFELLCGLRPVKIGDNAIKELMTRLTAPPLSPRATNPSVPADLDAVVVRCLQVDPAARFDTTADLAAALEDLDDEGRKRLVTRTAAPSSSRGLKTALLGSIAALLAVGGIAAWLATKQATPTAPTAAVEPVSVLIANFENKTGDQVFEGALEQALGLGVEGATFITAFPRQTAQRVVQEIKQGATLSEEGARLVAVREGIKIVLAGSIESAGGGYRLSIRAMDPAAGKTVASADETASDKTGVLAAVGELATSIRRELGDTTVENTAAGAETFTVGSLEAARAYSKGQDLLNSGRPAEAIPEYELALKHDPNFGRAYSGWAIAAFRLGRADEADQLFKKALGLMERMTEREKYRTLGGYYLGPGANDEQAIANYKALVERYPSDTVGLNNLAVAYSNTLDFKSATEYGKKAAAAYPTSASYQTNLALYAMYGSDFETAVAEAKEALTIGAFDKAYLPLAVAAVLGGKPDEAVAAYQSMAKVGARGASIASLGLADLAIYRGRLDEAQAELQRGIDADQQAKQQLNHALKLVAMAEASLLAGDHAATDKLLEQALALSQSDGVVVPAALMFVSTGRDERARALAAGLEKQLQRRRRAMSMVIQAELSRKAGRLNEAIDILAKGRGLADLWLLRFTLGRVYLDGKHFAEANQELEACQTRIGESAAMFLDDWPTVRYAAPLTYWLARAQEGLDQTESARKNYQAYLNLRGTLATDPLAVDAKKRLGG